MPDNPRDDLIDILETVSKAQLQALRRLRRAAGQQKPAAAGVGKSKRMSHIDIVYDILLSATHPLHISEILALVAKRHGVALDRESIVSALAKRVARKDRFVRTGPNTFSLLPETER
jgi:hypothetical protein